MTSGLLGGLGMLAVFLAGAWLAHHLTAHYAERRQRAVLDRLKRIYEAKQAAVEREQDRLADALFNLLGAANTPYRDADTLDAARVGAEAALDGHGYTGQLTALKAALEEAESDATTYCMALVEMLDAIDEERVGDLDGIRQIVADTLARGTARQGTS